MFTPFLVAPPETVALCSVITTTVQIKVISTASKHCTTLAGTGAPGLVSGDTEHAQFSEPGGLCLGPEGKSLFIADTNNHAIRVLDLDTKQVTEVCGCVSVWVCGCTCWWVGQHMHVGSSTHFGTVKKTSLQTLFILIWHPPESPHISSQPCPLHFASLNTASLLLFTAVINSNLTSVVQVEPCKSCTECYYYPIRP